jgi:hypothetical protein
MQQRCALTAIPLQKSRVIWLSTIVSWSRKVSRVHADQIDLILLL